MRRPSSCSLLPLVVLLAACPSTGGPTAPAPAAATADWPALQARAAAGDTTLDFTEYRLAYTTTTLYSPYGRDDDRVKRSVDSLLTRGEHQAARDRLKVPLAEVPVDIDLLAMDGFAAGKLGDTATAAHHRWMMWGLLNSIAASGQGTKGSPMVVISVDEEYALARMLGLRPSGVQSLGECNGKACDRVLFRTRTGSDTTLFFDVSLPQAQFRRTLRH